MQDRIILHLCSLNALAGQTRMKMNLVRVVEMKNFLFDQHRFKFN